MWYETVLCEKLKWALISDWTVDERLPHRLKIVCTNKTLFDFESEEFCIHRYPVSHTLPTPLSHKE